MTSTSRYTYTAYGLRFESSFPLPEMRPAAPGRPDITIAWQSGPGQMLLSVVDVARYLVVENREVRIHPLPGSTEADVRAFLLGSILGALLHAQHMLVLHASVICTERGAVLFMGRSGAGKSTLLGAFLQRGYRMLADDKAGITLNEDGMPQALPGLPCIRLAEDAATTLQYPVHDSQRRRGLDKYVVPVEQFHTTPVVLRGAYSLSAHNGSDIRLEQLPTLDRFQALNRNTYRRRFIQQTEQRHAHFRILGAVSNHARVARVLRPGHPYLIDQLRECIEEDLAR
jgi:hypothetical protein